MFYLNIYLQYTFSSWPMTTISSFLSLRACIASAATAPAVIRLGKHLVTVTTILEETMKAEQVTSSKMVIIITHVPHLPHWRWSHSPATARSA